MNERKMFENLCDVLLHSGQRTMSVGGITDKMDNLFYEKFGMSSDEIYDVIFKQFDIIV